MTYSYYPGCTLKTKAKDLDRYGRLSAEALGVQKLRKSQLGECLFIGELPRETGAESFAARVKEALGCSGLRYTTAKATVKTVAVASGSGGSDIFAAAEEGADVLVTGEIKHHAINEANDLGITVVDAGHFKSENIVIRPLINKLSERFDDIIFTKSKNYDDNIKFC